jgi:hypothetical protein
MHYIEDIGPLIQSVGSFDDLSYPRAPFYTSKTFDVGEMSLDIVNTSRWVIIGQEGHRLDSASSEVIRVSFDDIILGDDYTPIRMDDGALFMQDNLGCWGSLGLCHT